MDWKTGIGPWAILATAVAGMQPATADAQSLGGLVKRIGREAINESKKPGDEPSGTSTGQKKSGPSSSGRSSRAALPAPEGVVPWPINAGQVSRPSLFQFSPEIEEQKRRYRQASSFPCSTCEASLDFDNWRKFFGHPHETFSSWSKIMGGWTVGRRIAWKGQAHDGVITVLSEAPVGEFQCRQLHHRMTTRGPRPVITERPGLICNAKQEYSSVETWHEVF